MLHAGVLALAITASSLNDSEFDAEAWKAQKDEELKFLLKVRELAHEHARVAAGSRFDDDRWGRRWALGEAAYNYGTAHLAGKFSCATSYAEAARSCTHDEATELRRWFAATLEEWRPKVGAGALAHTLPPGLKRVASPWQRDETEL